MKGEFGYINVDGKPGSHSCITTTDAPDFWDYIEDGIKPLVAVLVKHGIETHSSCQGHYIPDEVNEFANVIFFSNRELNDLIRKSIKDFPDKDIECTCDVIELDGSVYLGYRIGFLISPKHRDKLDDLIIRYSKFLDELLTNHYDSNSEISKLI